MRILDNREILQLIRQAGEISTIQIYNMLKEPTDKPWHKTSQLGRIYTMCSRLHKQGYLRHPTPQTWSAVA